MTENWIWGFHSLEACIENFPEVILELQSELPLGSLPKNLQALIQRQSLKCQSVSRLPKHLSEKRTQGIAARLKYFPTYSQKQYFEDVSLQNFSLYLMLDRIEDPRNYGALLRSAAAFGVDAVFVADRSQSPLTGVVAQASAGQCFRIPVVVCSSLLQTLEKFREEHLDVFALEQSGEDLNQALAKHKERGLLWLLGSEGEGIRSSLLERVTKKVNISIAPHVESLNASVAASIALYASRLKLNRGQTDLS